jgi:Rrf2 family iron-sulfur cluster assembly transcriptional regulator
MLTKAVQFRPIVDSFVRFWNNQLVKVTAQEEYGLRCILQLASAPPGEPFTVGEIARREGLSVAYVEKLLRILGRAGLTQSQRGIKGGYRLAKPSEQITLGDVGRALGAIQTAPNICRRYTGNLKSCIHDTDCGIRPIWQEITEHVLQVMDNIPISKILCQGGQLVRISSEAGSGQARA